jgi:hypothetical protein
MWTTTGAQSPSEWTVEQDATLDESYLTGVGQFGTVCPWNRATSHRIHLKGVSTLLRGRCGPVVSGSSPITLIRVTRSGVVHG